MKNMKKILSLLLSLVLMLGLCLSVNVSAEDSTTYTVTGDKTITVNNVSSDDYTKNTGIQDAINYINTQSDKTGWTITVSSGTYKRFTILDDLDNLTINAADDATVVINVLDGSTAPLSSSYIPDGYRDDSGVMIRIADNITFDGLTFQSLGSESSGNSYTNSWSDNWYLSAISLFADMNNGYGCGNLTVNNCTFEGAGIEYGIFSGSNNNDKSQELYVNNCTFNNLYAGICFMCDNGYVQNVEINNNIFTSCDRAIDSYFGNSKTSLDSNEMGYLKFINNTVTGTTSMYCKVLLTDQYATTDSENHDASGYVTISGNVLENACLVLFEMETNLDLDALIDNNTFCDNTYIAVGSEAQNVITLTYSAQSDEDQKGYWELLDTSEISAVSSSWTVDEISLITDAISEANETGAHTLVLDFSSLYTQEYWSEYVYTIMTRLKYGVRWVGTPDYEQEPSVTKYVNGTDNESATTDDDGNYNVYAGDTVDFSLSILGPDYLYVYTGTGGLEGATERGTYEITVHDVMDDILTLDESSIEISIEGAIVSSDYYTVITDTDDDCEFHIVIDLVALYNAGLYVDSEEVITINYSAVVSSDAAIGTYENSTWLTYEYINKTEVSTVEINVVEVESESEEEPETTVEPTNSGEEETAEEEVNEEEVETETSDNTAIYMYATLGLLAAGGYLAITKKNLLRK